MELHLLSAGAAQGVVNGLAETLRAETGYTLTASFGAVGAMKEKLLAGTPADLIILTRALVDELAAEGRVVSDSRADLGVVRTGVAARRGEAPPDVATPAALRAALLDASGIYFPDPQRATAGIHFAHVLDELGVRRDVEARLRPHPNGATAMREMATSGATRSLGCTQITEINNTPGVTLVGPLPREFELATTYSVGVCTRAASPDAARRFVEMLTGTASRTLRERAGFELRAAATE